MAHRITLQCLTSQHKCVLLFNKHQSNLAGMKYTLAQRLQMARQHRGISQEQLAQETGIRQSAISRIECGGARTTGYASRLAKACGVRTDWLAEEDGEMLPRNENGFYVTDHRVIHAAMVMEAMPEYAKKEGVERIDALAQLLKNAKENGTQ